jgi:hypothetical protein
VKYCFWIFYAKWLEIDTKQITHQQQGMNFVFQDHKTDTSGDIH